MTPIQQLMFGVGGAESKTYMDDLFSTYLWAGSGSSRSINTGVNMSKGGLTWIKRRDGSDSHALFDTSRGATKGINSNTDSAEGTDTDSLTSFNNNGFSLGTGYTNFATNLNNTTYSSWSFRKAPGFFDIVTYTGNATLRTISHSLGSIPGCIMIKRLDTSGEWIVYHRNIGATKYLRLDANDAHGTSDNFFNDTEPTASVFTIKQNSHVNANNGEYVAYLFAGGESTAATARSVSFNGSGEKLSFAADDDFHLPGDFTVEGWFYPVDTGNDHYWAIGEYGQTGGILFYIYGNKLYVQESGSDRMLMDPAPSTRQWAHIALVRSGSTMNCYVNGTSVKEWTYSSSYGSGSQREFYIGGSHQSDAEVNISNFRIVKGTAVYTSSFKPPTEPLTNITNTVLLCCNQSSATGSTITPSTITASGSPGTSTDSPFDDPAGFIYGENEDQNVIKCGSFRGNHTDKPEIYLGWEPQFLLWKNTDQSQDWFIVDSMRGAISGDNDNRLRPNNTDSENTSQDPLELTPTGFKCVNNDFNINGNGDTTVYIAIRRSDGYVGKLPEAGTDVLKFAAGQGGASEPNYPGGGIVDYHITRDIDSTNSFYTGARMIGTKYLKTDGSDAGANSATWVYHYMNGYNSGSSASDWKSWQWKRYAGFDVVAYTSNNTQGHTIAHSLGRVPEMIWFKNLDQAWNWNVYHKGANGGTDPQKRHLRLNTNDAEVNLTDHSMTTADFMDDKMPTATHFTLGDGANPNSGTHRQIALLFSSVDKISKVGSYSGSGSTGNAQNIGFQPRLLIIKRTNSTGDWFVFNSVSGFGNYLQLNTTQSENNQNYVSVSSTGFSLVSDYGDTNESGSNYIYYAHA